MSEKYRPWPTLEDYALAFERIAWSIPAPNEWTPHLVMLAQSMRAQSYAEKTIIEINEKWTKAKETP